MGRSWPARIVLIACSVLPLGGAVGCTLYQMPPANPSTEAAIAQANKSCGPTTGEVAERLAAMPLLVPLDMVGLVEPGIPLLENSNTSTPECRQASARATQAVETDNQTACVQFATAALAKYPTDQWQQVSCQCRKFIAERRFVSQSSTLSFASAQGYFVDSTFAPSRQPGLQVEVMCENRSDVIRVIPTFPHRFPNYGCAKPVNLGTCE